MKDLAPKRALKRLWGSFEGRLGRRTSKLPQSNFYFRARWVLSQFISVTGGCDERGLALDSRSENAGGILRLENRGTWDSRHLEPAEGMQPVYNSPTGKAKTEILGRI